MADAKMEFCLNFTQGPPSDFVDLVKMCDEVGIQAVGIADSPILLREIYITSAMCALNTKRTTIMTAVTNPVTRHPSVTATAAFSLEELAPGRLILGIATGDSALWSIGVKPAKLAYLREYILAVKALLRGEAARWEGKTFKAEWGGWSPPVEVPIIVACAGPKTLKMAAQVADGLIVAMGYAPEDIAYANDLIAEACAEVGRNPDELDIWWTCDVKFAASAEAAMADGFGWAIDWMTMGSMEGKRIPEEYKPLVRELTSDAHDLDLAYKTPGRGRRQVELAKRLGIYDWVLSRSPRLWGTPDDVTQRLHEFGALGLRKWIFYVGGADFDLRDTIDKLAHQVMPNFS